VAKCKNFLSVVLLCSLCGCGYLNAPIAFDYTGVEELTQNQVTLSQHLSGIESHLTELERALETYDQSPTSEDMGRFLQRFPWLSGVVFIDPNGEVLTHQPDISLASFNFAPLAQMRGTSFRDRNLAGIIQKTELGDELFLGTPIFSSTEYLGMLVVHFDIRAMLQWCDEPDELIILTPSEVLWSGKFNFAKDAFKSIDWEKRLGKAVSGVCRNDEGRFAWLVRYAGECPLIFCTSAQKKLFRRVR